MRLDHVELFLIESVAWLHSRINVFDCHPIPGGVAGGATPVPIPNTEVKPSRVDGTAGETLWESRTLPELFTRRALCIRTRASANACSQERKNPGDDLFSRKAALSVSSALESLTAVFGMGTGMASPLMSPGFRAWIVVLGCACATASRRGAEVLRFVVSTIRQP